MTPRDLTIAMIVVALGIMLLDHLVGDLAARVHTLEIQYLERNEK